MHIQKRKLADGRFKYYIRYWENGKNKTISTDITGHFYSREAARDWLKSKKAEKAQQELEKYIKAKARYEWRNKYHNFDETLEKFEIDHKKKAPNSYKNTRTYLERFVFNYFGSHRGLNNFNSWYRDYYQFKEWLETTATRKDGKPLSYSTRNHIICALNLFMKFCEKRGYLQKEFHRVCEVFPQSEIDKTARNLSDLINEEEFKNIKGKLDKAKDFFTVLYHTGMRFNELYSLPYTAVYPGKEKVDKMIVERLEEHGYKIYGYLILKDQLVNKSKNRKIKDGQLDRKPLKSKKDTTAKNWRIIPIIDKETWNIIVKRYNRASRDHERKKYKSSRAEDYLLFDTVNHNTLNRELRKVTDKGYHACRHSRSTFLIKILDIALTRIILGHSSMKAFNRYWHLNEEMTIEAATANRPKKLKLVS